MSSKNISKHLADDKPGTLHVGVDLGLVKNTHMFLSGGLVIIDG